MPDNRIRIWPGNSRYWQYRSKPTMLIGGSVEDNLFQIPDLEAHLDLLHDVGGNYVRCTMSCRDEGDVWPFRREGDLYNLERWNPAFWQRFSDFLRLTSERSIVVQIEIWATFDYYRDNWAVNPFNPKNNLNYTPEETGLPVAVESHPVKTENNFFWSIPAENNQETVLRYQHRFVDEILGYSLPYGNVLYCMDNETSVTPEWGAFWSQHIKRRAREAGMVNVETTEMWDAHDLAHPQHKNTLDHPEIYSFVDISQNNHQKGQAHWDNMQKIRRSLDPVRPLNSVKIYGADTGRYGDDRDGQERFWRNIIGGLASARFHRPPAGLGLSPKAQANLKSARMLLDRLDIFDCEPHNDLLHDRPENGAYCTAQPGRQYAIYFPAGQPASLDVKEATGRLATEWLNVAESRWEQRQELSGGQIVTLEPPSQEQWVALVGS